MANTDQWDVLADGAGGYAKWVQTALILYRVELEKSLRETDTVYCRLFPDSADPGSTRTGKSLQ